MSSSGWKATAPSATIATPRRVRAILKNAQPFVVEYSQGPIAISHNGNLVNGALLREELERAGSIFQSTTDTEVIIHLIATSKGWTLMSRIVEALSRVRGAYSLVVSDVG